MFTMNSFYRSNRPATNTRPSPLAIRQGSIRRQAFLQRPMAAMLSVYDALLVRDFEAATLAIDSNSGCFDFLELHPVHQIPPLMLLVAQAVQHETATSSFSKYRVKEQRAGVVALARAMIDAGADAMQSAPFECQFVMHASTSKLS